MNNKETINVTHSYLVQEWVDEKNIPLLPSDVTAGSHKKVWWRCSEGHEWKAQVSSRCLYSSGCPRCSEIKNSVRTVRKPLATLYPEIFNELKDKEITVVGAGSHKELAWVCAEGHEEKEKVFARVKRGGCSECRGNGTSKYNKGAKPLPKTIADQWHPTKNLPLTLDKVSYGSTKRVWWLCDKGHEWEGRINARKSDTCFECYKAKTLVFENSFASRKEQLVEWGDNKLPEEVSLGSKKRIMWKCSNNPEHTWSTFAYQRGKINPSGCPECSNNIFTSKAEDEIANHILSLGENIEIIRNDRKILDGEYELDIYLPEYKLAIEYNGLYWHNESHRKDKNYHYNKYKACADKGIQLIQIWEDDWTGKSSIVMKMISHKLSLSKGNKTMARKTSISEISYNEASAFLDNNHIQGASKGSKYCALVNTEGKKVAVLVAVKRTSEEWEIARYATEIIVAGGFTKMLKYLERTNPEIKRWVTFSDNCISNGALYVNNGFTVDRRLRCDYSYVINQKRIHKFNYRLKMFKDNPDLLFDDNYTETQLAELNGIPRIWDAGKIRWLKIIQ